MKALLITIIVIILLVFGYNRYSDYQRFSLESYEYEAIETGADSNPQTALLYHQKIAELNGFVITQWSANRIDVRNPENDDAATLAARNAYDNILGAVKFLEGQIKHPKKVQAPDTSVAQNKRRHDRIKELFTSTPNNTLRIGSRGALVYELQKLLNENGSDIPEDGNFQRVTFDALTSFEQSKKLFPDGKLDMLTLEHLLEK